MNWEAFAATIALVFGGSFAFVWAAFWLSDRDIKKQRVAIGVRDIRSLHLTGKWYAERQEALAEEAVAALGWDHDPYSIQAEICREVVTCGRHPDDAVQRLRELERGSKHEI